MTDTQRTPRPPDINRRTLTPFGYVVCVAVPILVAVVGLTLLRLNYDKDDLVDGRQVGLLTSEWEPGDASALASFGGELTYSDGCVRVGGAVVVWPKDYLATVRRVGRSDQLTLYDPDRAVVGRGGDEIEVGGAYGDVGDHAGRACAPESGDVFFVQSDVTVRQGS